MCGALGTLCLVESCGMPSAWSVPGVDGVQGSIWIGVWSGWIYQWTKFQNI